MNRTITDFLNNELKEYANDIIKNRCIPSIVDSFKPIQRKIMWVSNNIWKIGNEKPVKVFSLVGSVSSLAYYHHGDASCSEAICNMNQTFKNNLPMLEGIGQYGSLRSPFHAQDRYISTKLHPNFRLVYKDFELLENQIDEGVEIEPKWFLGIIPMIIVNQSMGIGMGFASTILGRNPKDVIDNCINHIEGKKVKELKPWLSEFSGEWVRDADNKKKWYIHGKYEISNTKPEIHITELPPDMTFEKYEVYLDSLVDGKILRDYDNNSSSNVDYLLKFRKEEFDKIVGDKEKLEKLLKINDSVTENLTTIDENEKLKVFDCVEDMLVYFVDFRMGYYQKRKDYLIGKWTEELNEMIMRAKFIKAIISKKLVVNNVPKDEIVSWLDENKFDRMDGSYGYLLNMPIHSLTKEKYDELLNKTKAKKEQIDEYSRKGTKEMYLEDLYELKRKIKS